MGQSATDMEETAKDWYSFATSETKQLKKSNVRYCETIEILY